MRMILPISFKKNSILIIFSILLLVLSILSRDISVSAYDYHFYLVYIIISILFFIGNTKFAFPKKYVFLLLLYMFIQFLTSYLSPYAPGLLYMLVGLLFTVLPFVNFIISYNYNFSHSDIKKFIDTILGAILIIAFIFYVETFLFSAAAGRNGFISSNTFMVGFFASLCSQGIVLSLGMWNMYRDYKYLAIIAGLSLTIFLTLQLKALLGLFTILFVYRYLTSKHKFRSLLVSLIFLIVMILIALSVPRFSEKIDKYISIYGTESSGIARVELYRAAFEISEDFFPLGTGQGTYGSIPINLVESKVYADYDLERVWGLSPKTDGVDFRMDTHWSSIIGENGALGTLIYILVLTYPISFFRKYKLQKRYRGYYLIVLLSITVLMFESIVLALPGRFCFMTIYSTLTAIIIKTITKENMQQYESVTSNNKLSK